MLKRELELLLESWTDEAKELESRNRGLYEEGKLVSLLGCIGNLKDALQNL